MLFELDNQWQNADESGWVTSDVSLLRPSVLRYNRRRAAPEGRWTCLMNSDAGYCEKPRSYDLREEAQGELVEGLSQ